MSVNWMNWLFHLSFEYSTNYFCSIHQPVSDSVAVLLCLYTDSLESNTNEILYVYTVSENSERNVAIVAKVIIL